jgi:DNA-binding transcriptional regulator GbsR (MarR family)
MTYIFCVAGCIILFLFFRNKIKNFPNIFKPKKGKCFEDKLITKVTEEISQEESTRQKQEELGKMVSNLTSELTLYRQKEQEERLRKLQLEALCDPKIVNRNLRTQGKVISYEGTSTYEEIVTRKAFINTVQLDVKLIYKFGIGVDWSQLKVSRFVGDIVIMSISHNSLALYYLELSANESKTSSSKKFLTKDFEPEFVADILKRAEEKTYEKVRHEKDHYDEAYSMLKQQLKSFISHLGFNDVVFE